MITFVINYTLIKVKIADSMSICKGTRIEAMSKLAICPGDFTY